jgi:hypothetical protein
MLHLTSLPPLPTTTRPSFSLPHTTLDYTTPYITLFIITLVPTSPPHTQASKKAFGIRTLATSTDVSNNTRYIHTYLPTYLPTYLSTCLPHVYLALTSSTFEVFPSTIASRDPDGARADHLFLACHSVTQLSHRQHLRLVIALYIGIFTFTHFRQPDRVTECNSIICR